jgi:hypothetical protein
MRLLQLSEWYRSNHYEQDKISAEEELTIRNKMVDLIRTLGSQITAGWHSIAKAITIFHIYSRQHSFKRFEYWYYGAAALHLACKLDDHPKDLEKVVHQFSHHLVLHAEKLPRDEIKIRLCAAEKALLAAMGYDLDIQLPYFWLVEFQRQYPVPMDIRLYKIATGFLNDSFRTLVILFYEPWVIALAAIKLSSIYLGTDLPDVGEVPWYKILSRQVEYENVEQCSYRICELYGRYLARD